MSGDNKKYNNNNNSEADDKYDLYTENIKKPLNIKYRGAIEFAKLACITGVLACVAGACFGLTFRAIYADKNKEDKRVVVSIPQDEYPYVSEEPVETTYIPQITGEVDPSLIDIPNTDIWKEESVIAKQYSELETVLAGIDRSLVTVTSSSYHGEDYLTSIWEEKSGAGAIIADNGVEYLILTRFSLCRDADNVNVIFLKNYKTVGRLVMGDSVTDTAIVAVEHEDIDEYVDGKIDLAVTGNSYKLNRGQTVIAVGTLYGLMDTVECGMAINTSNIMYDADGRYGMIYTNIASSEDNSGFLFNGDGEIIGFITSNYDTKGNLAAYGISDLKKLIENMSNEKNIAYLGIVGYDISETAANENGIPIGAYVGSVQAASPAFYAGIQSGDVITNIDDRNILNVYNLSMALLDYSSEDRVMIKVYRKGKAGYVPIEFEATLSVK